MEGYAIFVSQKGEWREWDYKKGKPTIQEKLSRTKPQMPLHEWLAIRFTKLLIKQGIPFVYREYREVRNDFIFEPGDYVEIKYGSRI